MIYLTKKKQELVCKILQGKSNKIIAYEMGVTEPTVKMHVYDLLKMFKVDSRLQLALYLLQNGYENQFNGGVK